jgi:hypothetical protein
MWKRLLIETMKSKKGVSEPWKALQIDYRKRLKDTWILCEVVFTLILVLIVAMTASQTRIAETIDAFYGEAGTKDNVSAYYRQAVEDLDAETVKELVVSERKSADCRMVHIELVSLIRYPGSVHTSLISTKPSRNAHINFSITMPFVQKLNDLLINRVMILQNFQKQRRRPPWLVKSMRT